MVVGNLIPCLTVVTLSVFAGNSWANTIGPTGSKDPICQQGPSSDDIALLRCFAITSLNASTATSRLHNTEAMYGAVDVAVGGSFTQDTLGRG